jgi:hypothetical protein
MGWYGSSDAFNKRKACTVDSLPNIYRVIKDILIYSPTRANHLADVRWVLQVCMEHMVALN